mmetsp:Transcript_12314/g.56066  ORF Transcript_12314/g.56066 Transcript_12314/m.56066 type:complete len:341 (+) Transcript_12314:4303-5325(+)
MKIPDVLQHPRLGTRNADKPLTDGGREIFAGGDCGVLHPHLFLVHRPVIFGVNLQLLEIQHVRQLEHIPKRVLRQRARLDAHGLGTHLQHDYLVVRGESHRSVLVEFNLRIQFAPLWLDLNWLVVGGGFWRRRRWLLLLRLRFALTALVLLFLCRLRARIQIQGVKLYDLPSEFVKSTRDVQLPVDGVQQVAVARGRWPPDRVHQGPVHLLPVADVELVQIVSHEVVLSCVKIYLAVARANRRVLPRRRSITLGRRLRPLHPFEVEEPQIVEARSGTFAAEENQGVLIELDHRRALPRRGLFTIRRQPGPPVLLRVVLEEVVEPLLIRVPASEDQELLAV